MEAQDLFATHPHARIALASAQRIKLTQPKNFRKIYADNKISTLRTFLNKTHLKGKRCRLVTTKAHKTITMQPLDSFQNVQSLAKQENLQICKGFVVFEWDEAPQKPSYVALRHWWCQKPSGEWVDFTPIPGTEPGHEIDNVRLLVESTLGEKDVSKPSPAIKAFTCALAKRILAGAAPKNETCPSTEIDTIVTHEDLSNDRVNVVDKPMSRPLDYKKWDKLEISDDEEEDTRSTQSQMRELREQKRAQIEADEAYQTHRENVNAAVNAAVVASTNNDFETLERLDQAARQTVPLEDEMEQILDTLPLAAKLAARAAVSTQAPANSSTCLSELLASQQIDVGQTEDPGLEDPSEFFIGDDEIGNIPHNDKPERRTAKKPASQPSRVEWLGDWS